MFTQRFLRRWRERWRGPPVRLAGAGCDAVLGEGDPRTEVVLHGGAALHCPWRAPSLVFGEGYMRGEIEVRGSLMDFLEGMYRTWPDATSGWVDRLMGWWCAAPRRASPRRSTAQARRHYDLGNDFFRLWLDPSMTYSCAYFLSEEDDLAAAQAQKVELLCRKARLETGQTLLDIGCGWGSLLFHAARRYGVHATGVTPSVEQARRIHEQALREGLGERVQVMRGDWREVEGRYDRIISVGMFEHVGVRQYRAFFRKWRELLSPGGLSILHTIGRMAPQPMDPWITRYIFPGGYLPALTQIASFCDRARLRILDVENLAGHYARTLAHWWANFEAARDRVVRMYDEPFARMWELYLRGSEAGFRWGGLQLWQVVVAHAEGEAPWPLDREVGMGRAERF